ncbi:MAG: YhdP family phospholipid transporter [Wenzhouxiangella sp.]
MDASPSTLRRVLRRLRALVLTSLAVLIILTGLIVGLGRTLIPHADQLRPWLESVASERLGQRVTLGRVEAEWPRLTPSLSLLGVQLDDGAGNRLSIDRARLEIHLPNLLNRRMNLVSLVLLGLELALEPDADGRWGLQLGAGGDGNWQQALPPGDLIVRDATLRVRPQQLPETRLYLEEGSVQRRGERTHFQGVLNRPDGDETLQLRLTIDHPDQQWLLARGWLDVQGLAPDVVAAALGLSDIVGPEAGTKLDAQIWMEWALDSQRLDLDLALAGHATRPDSAPRLHATVALEPGQIQLEVHDFVVGDRPVARGLAVGRRWVDERPTWAVAVDALDLGGLHQALAPWLQGWAYWPVALDGQIDDLLLGLDQSLSLHAADGQLRGLHLEWPEPLPSLSGLDLALSLDGDRLRLAPGGALTARWRHHIRGDMAVDSLSGQLVLAPDSIELRALAVDGPVAQASASGWIYLRRPRPFLDFVIEVERVGPVDPRPYLSYRTIPEPAMNWLDTALLWVEQASGVVNLHLTAGTRARDLRPGAYQALVDFRGVSLDYWEDWPAAGDIQGSVAFIGNQLSGRVERARLGEVELAAPKLEIPELTAPVMALDLAAVAVAGEDLLALLAEIPVPGWQATLSLLRWQGPLDASASLHLPFRNMSDWAIAGEAAFAQARVGLLQPALALDGLSGSVRFDQTAIAPTVLEARLADQVFDLSLAAGFAAPAFFDLAARFNPADLDLVAAGLGPLAEQVRGASDWTFRLEALADEHGGGLEMLLRSDLAGLALDWPMPLSKPAAARWPAHARLLVQEDRQALAFQIDPLLAGRWQAVDARQGLALQVGPDALGQLPDWPASGTRIRGRLEQLAASDWMSALGGLPLAAAAAEPEDFDLRLEFGRLVLPGLSASAAKLALARTDEGWSGQIESPELAGAIAIPMPLELGRAVVADFSRLHLERAPPVEPPGEPVVPVVPEVAETVSDFSPRGLPPLSLAVEDLRWGDLILGRARIEAHPIERGLEVELFDINGPDLRLQGRGRWVDAEPGPESEFIGRLTSPSLSALVRAAGFDAGIEAARAQVDLDVRWRGAPPDFALRRLNGALDLQLDDGEIPDARPGAGRLLGLASFNAIPRRLMLDFRDVFAAGLRFDDVVGSFELQGGFALTDGLVLRSPAAVITISGTTDMAARRYDQQVLVEPGLGATLPVIGGLAGGPVGAAAGLVLRQLLERPLRGLADVRYEITGPWEAPEVVLVGARLPDEVAEPAARGGNGRVEPPP